MAGRVGRPALPSNVHVLRGNLSKKTEAELLAGFKPDVELPPAPDHLHGDPVALAEYERLGAEAVRYRIMAAVDRGALAMAAVEWSRHVWAEEKIRQLNAEDARGEKGLVATTPNGYKVMSVYLQISNAAISAYLKLISEFGFTPASRSRVKPDEASPQGNLFGNDGDDGSPSIRSFAA